MKKRWINYYKYVVSERGNIKMEKLKKIIGIVFDGLVLVWVLFIIFCVFIVSNSDKTEVDNDISIQEPTFSTTTTDNE